MEAIITKEQQETVNQITALLSELEQFSSCSVDSQPEKIKKIEDLVSQLQS